MQIRFYAKIKWGISETPRTKNMPRQLTQLANGEIYHIVFRAVGDAVIFNDENDYYRGIFSIYEFNNKNFVEIWKRRRNRIVEKKKEKLRGSRRPPELYGGLGFCARAERGQGWCRLSTVVV